MPGESRPVTKPITKKIHQTPCIFEKKCYTGSVNKDYSMKSGLASPLFSCVRVGIDERRQGIFTVLRCGT